MLRTMERKHTSSRFIKQSISFPVSQLDWIRQEADRQEHGNLSRIVQEAIKVYRRQRLAEELERAERPLEKVA